MPNINVGAGSGGIATVIVDVLMTASGSTNSGALVGSEFTPPIAYNPNSPNVLQSYSLVSGNNSFAPVGTAGMAVLIPPSGNSQTLTLKGASGDTGVRIHKTAPTYLPLDLLSPNFIIAAGGPVTGFLIYWI